MSVRIDDIEVAYSEVGRGDPLVLVHGLADDHRAWRRTLPDLMLHRRVYLYDLRGHGQTTLGSPHGNLRQLSNDLLQFLDAIHLEQVDIAGFSLGGTVAMRFAIDFPLDVRGLVLVATSSRVGHAAADWYRQRVEMVESGDPKLRETLDRDAADVYAESPEELEEALMIRRQSTADPRGYGNACAAMAALNAAPLDPELGRITVPTLIIASEKDRHCPPKAAEIIAAGIKGSRLQIMPDAGHPIPVEKPRELAGSINSFLAEIA
jgi:3-oxoadipate enol-lactonase